MKLNLSCGWDYRKGWINTDISGDIKKDKYLDLNKAKLPFKNDSSEYIYMNHVIEHLSPETDIRELLKEIHRVLKPGGIFEMNCPHFSSWNAHQIDHKRTFSLRDFVSLKEFRVISYRLYNHYKNPPYDMAKNGFFSKVFNKLTESLASINPLFCERVWCNNVGGFQEMRFKLRKI